MVSCRPSEPAEGSTQLGLLKQKQNLLEHWYYIYKIAQEKMMAFSVRKDNEHPYVWALELRPQTSGTVETCPID